MICFALCMASPKNPKKWWHRIFLGLVDRSLCNACVVYNKLEMESRNLLSFRRSVKSLITLGKPLQVGRSISTLCNQVTAKKQRKSNFSVPASISVQLQFEC